jgi:hypothetical protein
MMTKRMPWAAVAATLLLPILPGVAESQGITIRERTRTEMGGPMGQMMRMMPGMGDLSAPQEQVTRIQGLFLREDSGESTTIIDAEGGRMITVDHDERTWMALTPEDMARMMERATEQMEDARNQMAERPGGESADFRMNVRSESRKTGERRTIAGFDAEQVQVTLFMEAEATDRSSNQTAAGTMVLFIDAWLTPEGPDSGAEEIYRRWAEQWTGSDALQQSTEAMSQMFAADPRLKTAMEEQTKAMEAMEGFAVRTTSLITTLPPGVDFDRERAIADLEGDLTRSGSSVAGSAARAVGAEAARGALRGMTRGVLGGRGGREAPAAEAAEEEAPLGQSTLLRTIEELVSVERGAIPADVFAPPAGYRQITLEEMMRGR